MRWERHNVNAMLVLRNGVCNRRWNETWRAARTQRRGQHIQQQQATSQQRLSEACWTLSFWSVRLARLSHRPAPAAPSPPVPGSRQPLARRLGTNYSWHKPFLRRPPSTAVRTEEVGAKK
jgi:hypothetical protein